MRKLTKRIAAMGAAMCMAISMMSIGASANQASYQDSNCIVLAYTSFTTSTAYSNGTVTNLSSTKTSYSVKSSLYSKTSGGSISSTQSNWKTASLKKDGVVKATASSGKKASYTYSAKTQVMRNNSPLTIIQSDYA